MRKAPRDFESLRTFLWAFACILPVCLLAYAPYISDHLLYDDVGHVFYFLPGRGFIWLDCLGPTDNGFWRPAQMLLMKLIYTFWEVSPRSYHTAMIIAHAMTAATLAMTWRGWTNASLRTALIVGLMFGVSLAAFPTVYMISNFGDGLLAMAVLQMMHLWRLWLQTKQPRYAWGTLICVLLAIAAKETGIVVVVPVVLMAWISKREIDKSTGGMLAGITVICATYALLSYNLQKAHAISYFHDGTSVIDWQAGLRNLRHLLTATLAPGGITMTPWWWVDAGTDAIAVKAAGWLMLVFGVIAFTIVILRRLPPTVQSAAVFYVVAMATLWPVLLLDLPHYTAQQQPIGRYGYTATALVYMAVAALAAATPLQKTGQRILAVAVAVWMILQVAAIRSSPGPRELERTAKQWERFVKETAKVSQGWIPPEMVTIYTGEPHGSILLPENYGNTLWRVYLPDLLANYYSNRTIPESTRAYIFDGKRLIETPLPQ